MYYVPDGCLVGLHVFKDNMSDVMKIIQDHTSETWYLLSWVDVEQTENTEQHDYALFDLTGNKELVAKYLRGQISYLELIHNLPNPDIHRVWVASSEYDIKIFVNRRFPTAALPHTDSYLSDSPADLEDGGDMANFLSPQRTTMKNLFVVLLCLFLMGIIAVAAIQLGVWVAKVGLFIGATAVIYAAWKLCVK